MYISQLSCNMLLYLISTFGLIFNRRNILITIMCIELVFLSLNLNFVVFSVYLNDLYGQLFALFVLTVAAAESAVGLAVIIVYYRIRGNIQLNISTILKY